MNMQRNASQPPSFVVAGYVRCSSQGQFDQHGIDAQNRALAAEAAQRGFSPPVFYEENAHSARSGQRVKRPAFQHLLEDVEAGQVQVVMVCALDRWSRSARVKRQSVRILSVHQTKFISLSENDTEVQA